MCASAGLCVPGSGCLGLCLCLCPGLCPALCPAPCPVPCPGPRPLRRARPAPGTTGPDGDPGDPGDLGDMPASGGWFSSLRRPRKQRKQHSGTGPGPPGFVDRRARSAWDLSSSRMVQYATTQRNHQLITVFLEFPIIAVVVCCWTRTEGAGGCMCI